MKINKNFCFLIVSSLLVGLCPDWARAAPTQTSSASVAVQQAKMANATDTMEGFAGNYLSGQFARAHGDLAEAIRYLQRVHASDRGKIGITRQLQGLLLLEGRVKEAIDLAEEILKSDPKDQLSGLLLALRDIKQDKMANASRIIDSVMPVNGGVQLWHPLVSAWLDLEQGLLEEPLEIETLAADINRAAPLVHYHLALINGQAGFTAAAVENYKRAIEDPKNPPMRIMAQMLRFYRNNGSPAALTSLVDSYLAADPDNAAMQEVPAVITAQDGVSEILLTMGGVMLSAGVGNDAAIYLQLALYIKPVLGDAAIGLGDAYSELEQYAKANESYARISSQSPFYAKAQLHIAVNEDRMGNTAEALALLDKLASHVPKEPEALVTKGDLLRIRGRYEEAVGMYTQALERISVLQANHWPILFARAACYEREGKWELAEADLRQALELKPGQPDILNYLGYGWLEHGKNIAEARQLIEKAVKARPNDAQIVDSMGWALYLTGNYQEAVAYLEKAVELLPGDPTVNDHLGDAYWRLGRKTEARFQWERSLTFSPEPKAADAIEIKLKEGLPPMNVAAETAVPRSQAANTSQMPNEAIP